MFKGIIIGSVLGALTAVLALHPSKEKRLWGYQNAAEFGCYQGIDYAALFVDNKHKREKVLHDALKLCEDTGKNFRNFVK